MAAPITFRNVPGAAAPNFGSSLFAIQRASDDPNVLDALAEGTQGFVDDKQQQDTDAFVAQLNSFRDVDIGDGGGIVTADMQRQQFLTEQLGENSFIDPARATQGVTDNRAQDFLKSGEARAVEDQALQVQAQDSALLNDFVARDVNEQLIKQSKVETKQANQDLIQSGLDDAATNAVNADKAATRKQRDANKKLQATALFAQQDLIAVAPGLTDPRNDSVQAFQEFEDALRAEIRNTPGFGLTSGISAKQVTAKIDKIFDKLNLTNRRNAVTADAARTPAERVEFKEKQDNALEKERFDGLLDAAPDTFNGITTNNEISKKQADLQYIDAFISLDIEAGKVNLTKQQKSRLAVFRKGAIERFVPDTSTDPINDQTVAEITSRDLANFNSRIDAQVTEVFSDASPSEKLRFLRIAKEQGGKGIDENTGQERTVGTNIGTKLTAAKVRLDNIAKAGQAGSDQALETVIAPGAAGVKALKEGLKDTSKIDQELNARSEIRNGISELFKKDGKANPEGLTIDQDDLLTQSSRSYDLITERFPSMGEGEKVKIVLEAFAAEGQAKQGFFNDQIGLLDSGGDVDSTNDFKDRDLVDKFIDIAAKRGFKPAVNIKETNKLKKLEAQLIDAQQSDAVGDFFGLTKVDEKRVKELKTKIAAQKLKIKESN